MSDAVGTRHVFYAMSLQKLRVKEKNQLMAGWQGADMYGMQVTLNYMYDRHMTTKIGLKESTVASYMDTYDRYVRDEFGKQFVHNIRYSDIQAWMRFILWNPWIIILFVQLFQKIKIRRRRAKICRSFQKE